MARSETKIKEGAAPFLEQGEEVVAAVVARPRGWTQAGASAGGGAAAGLIGRAIGGKKQRQNIDAAQQSGFQLASPMALAVTPQRLLSLKVTAPVGLGIGMKVQELVSAVPVGEVDSIEVKRLAAGKTVTVTIRGVPFVLEVGAGADAKGVAEALERAKAAA
jgi:hypothetical protein